MWIPGGFGAAGFPYLTAPADPTGRTRAPRDVERRRRSRQGSCRPGWARRSRRADAHHHPILAPGNLLQLGHESKLGPVVERALQFGPAVTDLRLRIIEMGRGRSSPDPRPRSPASSTGLRACMPRTRLGPSLRCYRRGSVDKFGYELRTRSTLIDDLHLSTLRSCRRKRFSDS